MIVPVDNYASYATPRGVLAIPADQLLQITPRSGAVKFGLHPNLTAAQPNQTSLFSLFKSGQLAVTCNVGTLTAPIKKSDYLAGTHPPQLFSHSDQQSQWQTSNSSANSPTGWGGRVADISHDPATGFPTIASVAGVSVATVSKVVNGRPHVSPTTRALIESLLHEHEYVARRPDTARFPSVELVFHLPLTAYSLEILHGVLNDPKMEHHAFFYFRSRTRRSTILWYAMLIILLMCNVKGCRSMIY
jgi:hypothetical protein